MKRFYVFWFFFSAGWGYLMSQPFSGVETKTAAHILLALPLGALTAAMLLAVEAWRMRPGKLPAPNIELRPWHMPTGVMQFVFVTFMFSGAWGVFFGAILASSDFREPLFFLMMSVGGLGGIVGVHRALHWRFAA
jgi:hypothetical protein